MEDVDYTKDEEKQEDVESEKSDEKPEKTDEKTSGGRILPWIIMFFVVVLCGGAGFALGRFFVASNTPKRAEHSQGEHPAQLEYLKVDATETDYQKAWYFDLEPVTANLDEPGVTRYVRATLTLEIKPEVDQTKGRVYIDEKKPRLTHWLTIYLASLNLEDIRGDRNLKCIQSQILDAFNEQLFPDSKPHIKHILFKEFAVQ